MIVSRFSADMSKTTPLIWMLLRVRRISERSTIRSVRMQPVERPISTGQEIVEAVRADESRQDAAIHSMLRISAVMLSIDGRDRSAGKLR